MSKTTYNTKDTVDRPWCIVDLDGQVLGRVATGIAKLLTGKNRPEFTPGQDCGAFVVALNAEKIKVTGKKETDKIYWTHSNYPGGIKSRTFEQRKAANASEVVRDAVKGMLPKNKIGARLITKLKVYNGSDHPHSAQQPEVFTAEQLASL